MATVRRLEKATPRSSGVILAPDRTPSEAALVQLALALGAAEIGGPLTPAELAVVDLAREMPALPDGLVADVLGEIRAGGDPLGERFCALRPGEERRRAGAFWTPAAVVALMLDWTLAQVGDRLVDPGCGSGRFAVGAALRQPDLPIIACDLDPLATLLTRAGLAAVGARAARVAQADYLTLALPPIAGRTSFIANPPYVRHHGLTADVKAWAALASLGLGIPVSGLAGLHVLFYVATALKARPGDIGCFITSAEWLDVGYGAALRRLLLERLGAETLVVIEPRAQLFDGAQTTASIVAFQVGARRDRLHLGRAGGEADIRLTPTDRHQVLMEVKGGRLVDRERLASSLRWSPLLAAAVVTDADEERVPLGQIARVSRGVATGANDYFVLDRAAAERLKLLPWCRPAISDARENLAADGVVRDSPSRKLLLLVPAEVDRAAHPALDAYLRRGEEERRLVRGGLVQTVAQGYLATHRRPWWFLGAAPSPPIVASYMARQAPKFARNPDGLALLNVAHGLYPKHRVTDTHLEALVAYLNSERDGFRGRGRTYQGGLEKFEPREMEALPVPRVFGEEWEAERGVHG
jgi:SAM-dependent methyltransferase